MAKNSIPMPTGGSVLPKVISTLVVLAVLVVIVKHPADAAGWVQSLLSWAVSAVDGIAAFFRQLTG